MSNHWLVKLVYQARTQRREEDACFLFAPLRPGVRFILFWLLNQARAVSSFILACVLSIASLSCVKMPRRILHISGQTAPPASQASAAAAPLIDINTASPAELEKLPGIGRGLAARIVAYRSEYGRFRRTEHLMMVRGISERRYQQMRALISVE